VTLLLLVACAGADPADSAGTVTLPAEDTGGPPEHLADWGLFAGTLADTVPADGVLPYQVAARLWSDGADKERFLALPAGGRIALTELDDWTLPEGSVVVKHFAFPLDDRAPEGARRNVETRLLVRRGEAWEGEIYVWNDAQDDAVREVAGSRVYLDRVDVDGAPYTQEYLVPNSNQCESCHMRDDVMHLLGPDTRQMNRSVEVDGVSVAQIDWLAGLGVFDPAPPPAAELPAFPDPWDESVDLETRARAYLHANCSHCHRPGGGGGNSGLVLLAEETDPARYGVCKITSAAGAGTGGFTYGIVPGDPDHSIMVYRMASTDPEIKMPELPNLLPDADGLALIRAWIAGMEGSCE